MYYFFGLLFFYLKHSCFFVHAANFVRCTMKKGSGYPILQVSIFNASFVSTGVSAEQIEMFQKQAAQVVSETTGIDPEQILIEIKSRPLIDCRKMVLDPRMSIYCIWSDHNGESDRDRHVKDAVCSLIGQQFGTKHNPVSVTAIILNTASILVVGYTNWLKFMTLGRVSPLR